KPAQMPGVKPKTFEHRLIAEEWGGELGHTFPPFYDDATKILARTDERYEDALKNLSAKMTERRREFKAATEANVASDITGWPKPSSEPTLAPGKIPSNLIVALVAIAAVILVASAAMFFLRVETNDVVPGAGDTGVTTTLTTVESTSSTIQATPTTATTQTTLPGCWSYCTSINASFKGACMSRSKDCSSFGWNYYPAGKSFCPKNIKGLETFCCCGENAKFFTLLGNDTIPARDSEAVKGFI
ncbi:MAG: hypothetical protein NTU61_06245, partial [Candidatus Altiarchaeota archaeon]|nr:hypothetical protein [Candidatus Altiarchaeota archaeon]